MSGNTLRERVTSDARRLRQIIDSDVVNGWLHVINKRHVLMRLVRQWNNNKYFESYGVTIIRAVGEARKKRLNQPEHVST